MHTMKGMTLSVSAGVREYRRHVFIYGASLLALSELITAGFVLPAMCALAVRLSPPESQACMCAVECVLVYTTAPVCVFVHVRVCLWLSVICAYRYARPQTAIPGPTHPHTHTLSRPHTSRHESPPLIVELLLVRGHLPLKLLPLCL